MLGEVIDFGVWLLNRVMGMLGMVRGIIDMGMGIIIGAIIITIIEPLM